MDGTRAAEKKQLELMDRIKIVPAKDDGTQSPGVGRALGMSGLFTNLQENFFEDSV